MLAAPPWAGTVPGTDLRERNDVPSNTDATTRTAVHCDCGTKLLDDITVDKVTVRGQTYFFRRKSDYLVCGTCGRVWPAREIRKRAGIADDDD